MVGDFYFNGTIRPNYRFTGNVALIDGHDTSGLSTEETPQQYVPHLIGIAPDYTEVVDKNYCNPNGEVWVDGVTFSHKVYGFYDLNTTHATGDQVIHINNTLFVDIFYVGRSYNNIGGSAVVEAVGSTFGSFTGSQGAPLNVGGNLNISLTDSLVNGNFSHTMLYTPSSKADTVTTIGGTINVSLTGSTIKGSVTCGHEMTTVDANGYYKADGVNANISGSTITNSVYVAGRLATTKVDEVEVPISIGGSTVFHDVNAVIADTYVNGSLYLNCGVTVLGGIYATLSGATFTSGIYGKHEICQGTATNGVHLTVSGGKTTQINKLYDLNSITIDAGATLVYTGKSLTSTTITNNGTLTFDGSNIATGSSYADFTVSGTGTVNTANGAWLVDNRAYYYNVVDTTLDPETTVGTEVTVTINSVETKAIYGVNAFTTAADVTHTDAYTVHNGGDLGGGTNVLDSKTKITANLYGGTSDDYTGNIDLTLNGASSSATVLGGGSSLGSKVDGNINLTLTGATVDRIVYGGGQSGTVTGSITTTVSGNSKIGKNFYGGSLISSKTCGTYTAGAVNVNISGGSFGGHVVGGSRVNGASFTETHWLKQTVDSVALNVMGGTFFERASVFAGGYLVGKQNKDVQLEITNGVNVTLNADILGDTATYGSIGVYGGALASNYGTASIGKGTSAYAVQITVEGGHYSAIYGAGWAESNANSQVSGGVSIKVTGGSIGNLFAGGNNDTSGAKANVTGNAVITLAGGTVDNVYAASKYGTSKITGSSKVNITGGTITGKLSGFNVNDRDSVVAGTEAAATGLQTLDLDASISCNEVLGFDVWEVASGAKLTATSSLEAIDLDGVTLDFGSATSGWDIATAEAGITNLDEATIILTGVTSWTFENSCWTSNDKQWTLSVDKTGKTLTLAKA